MTDGNTVPIERDAGSYYVRFKVVEGDLPNVPATSTSRVAPADDQGHRARLAPSRLTAADQTELAHKRLCFPSPRRLVKTPNLGLKIDRKHAHQIESLSAILGKSIGLGPQCSDNISIMVLTLFIMVALTVTSIHISGWHLTKRLGYIMMMLHGDG